MKIIGHDITENPDKIIEDVVMTPMEEISKGPSLWLWDYLRRSDGAAGFFVPLSGGSDSAAVTAIVGSMCQIVIAEIKRG